MEKSHKSKREFILGTVEELELIDKDMRLLTGESLSKYIFNRVLKPWVEQSPNFPNDFWKLPRYVDRNHNGYVIERHFPDSYRKYGTYSSREDVLSVLDYVVFRDWDVNLSTHCTNLKGKKQVLFMFNTMDSDDEYQEYLRNRE